VSAPTLSIESLAVAVRTPEKSTRRVVDQVSFTIDPGKMVALVGESGSGKTMIGRAVLGLLPPIARVEAGRIAFEGSDLAQASEARMRAVRGREIGMVFQEPMVSLNPALTVGFQMMEALRLHYNLGAEEARRRSLEMLERVKIADPAGCFRAYPHQYSGGMRQRIMLASVLVMRPKLLIADEPTTALDALIQKEVMDIMAALTRDIGTAVLLVSHDLGMVANYADQVVMLRQGRVVESGATADILLAPRHEYTRMLLESLPSRERGAKAARAAEGAGGEPLVRIDGVSVEFRRKPRFFWQRPEIFRAVDKASLVLAPGETLAVVGESGSGKTTLGRALVRLVEESEGSIRFEGSEVTAFDARSLAAYRLKTQMVFQDPFSSLDPRMTLAAIVAEGLRTLPGLARAERERRARAMLAEVGLAGDYADRHPHELSGGQRQRVSIARAIVATPRLLVADEPVSALDVTVQKQILTLFSALQAKFGFSYLFISHDLGVVEQIADRVVVMYRGRILECGTRDQVYDTPRHPYTLKLLAATPRIARTAAGGYQLVRHAGAESAPPQGFGYYAGEGAPTMHEVAPGHVVAMRAA
jgi:peptide/nickel transport system ATP-binding protein